MNILTFDKSIKTPGKRRGGDQMSVIVVRSDKGSAGDISCPCQGRAEDVVMADVRPNTQ